MFLKTPSLMRSLYSKATWVRPSEREHEKVVFLTFDDGPTPSVTDWVLDYLGENKINSTFFCVGKNIDDNPVLFNRLEKEGHVAANHTYHHLNGWKTSLNKYFTDLESCEKYFSNKMFRPPYGKLTPSQYNLLKNKYEIIFWDILSYDYKQQIKPELSFNHIIRNVRDGSIIVFHDSNKAYNNLKFLLPRTINNLKRAGFKFSVL